MNKKVLTLCAGFLLAGSLTAVAQYCPQNGEVDYRTRLVKSASKWGGRLSYPFG